MYTIDTCPNLSCRSCKFYRANSDRDGVESLCKRIDHKHIRFAPQLSGLYDCGRNHIVCSDFAPAHPEYADFREWTGFEDFWVVFVKAWLPYENTNKIIWFIVGKDTFTMYGVPLMSFVNGTMIENGILKAEKKRYYSECEDDLIGCKLITEDINGVDIRTGVCF